jgi:hypothetical protein
VGRTRASYFSFQRLADTTFIKQPTGVVWEVYQKRRWLHCPSTHAGRQDREDA